MADRLVVFFFILTLLSCKGGRKVENKILPESFSAMDSAFIFNGSSLEGWEIANFGPQGPVYVSGENVILGMGEGCTGITYKNKFPEINYQVTLEAKKIAGNDFFCGMTFPVGKDPCSLIVGGWGGSTVGLSSINGKDASENETTTLQKFEKDRWYKISLTVKEDSIKAMIDDVVVVNFAIGNNKLSIRPEVELSKPFGITSWYTTAAIRNIKVVRIKE